MSLGGGAARRRWFGSAAIAFLALTVTLVGAPAMAVTLPPAGTPTAIAQAVAKSTSIQRLTSTVARKVFNAPNDNPAVDYPKTKNGCLTLTACVFGDKVSSKVIVVLGDSHAQMWIPTLNRIGVTKQMRVIILFMARCPAATLDVWLTAYNKAYTACSSTRSGWITAIDSLHPVTVLLTDHTNGVTSAASMGTQQFTAPQWQAGMQTTITDLQPSNAKIAIIGDTNTFNLSPPQCLAAYPHKVQTCSVPNPNPLRPSLASAEQAAAKAAAVLYVNPTKWLCTSTTCAPVIGSFIVYYDTFHLTCSYAAYLSGVMQTALKRVL